LNTALGNMDIVVGVENHLERFSGSQLVIHNEDMGLVRVHAARKGSKQHATGLNRSN